MCVKNLNLENPIKKEKIESDSVKKDDKTIYEKMLPSIALVVVKLDE